MSKAKEIWKTLSAIDVNKHAEKKNGFTYLSWTWAWATLQEQYPDSTYEFRPVHWLPNNTAEVWVDLTVEGITRSMWLAVTDFKNKAVVNPGCDLVANARMRCLVKAIAMFGLGHYIYAGESLPMQVSEPVEQHHSFTEKQKKYFDGLIEKGDALALYCLKETLVDGDGSSSGASIWLDLCGSFPKGEKGKKADLIRALVDAGKVKFDEVSDILDDYASKDDSAGIEEVMSELSELEKKIVIKKLNPQTAEILQAA